MKIALVLMTWLLHAQSAFAADCAYDGRYVMGTILEITLCAESAPPLRPQFEPLFAKALHLDTILTTYNPRSAVSRLNAHAGHGPFFVPQEVIDLLTLSLQYTSLTQGTFDVTVGPLMTFWQEAALHHSFPSQQQLRHIRRAIGSNKVRLRPNNAVVLRPGMAIDFGGIGKGYALDELRLQLKEQHIHRALLDFGQSSIWALGTPADAPGWRVAVQQPDGRLAGLLTLRNQALSISASMGQTFEINGQQYSHIIDPRTGLPLQRNLLGCVIAPTATQAEVLSKALLILGERQGLALLQRFPGTEGMLLEATGTADSSWMTPGWRQAVEYSED